MLDYTEDSEITTHDFGSDVSKRFAGLAEVRQCFTELFAYLNTGVADDNHGDGETIVGVADVQHDDL